MIDLPAPEKLTECQAKAIQTAFMNLYKKCNVKEIIPPAARAEEPSKGPRDKWGRQK